MGKPCVGLCCVHFFKGIKADVFIPVMKRINQEEEEKKEEKKEEEKKEETFESMVVIAVGTENCYNKETQEFEDKVLLVKMNCCPFCGTDITIKEFTDEEIEEQKASPLSENKFTKDDDEEGEEWKKK